MASPKNIGIGQAFFQALIDGINVCTAVGVLTTNTATTAVIITSLETERDSL